MTRKYLLRRPSTAELQRSAADLARADARAANGDVDQRIADGARTHAARVALPADWRTRNKLTSPEWPAPDDLTTWAALGRSHALSFTPAACSATSPTPAAQAYCAAYFQIGQAYMQPEQHIAPHRTHPIDTLKDQIRKHSSYFGALLKADPREQARFLAEVVQAVRSNEDLLNTDRDSLMFAFGEAAALGLSVNPGLGEAWIIPRRCKLPDGQRREDGSTHVYRANFQPGYKGLIKLAYRSGIIDSFFCEVAFEGEGFKRRGGTNPSIEHEPDEEARAKRTSSQHAGDTVCAYAAVWLKGSSRPLFAVVDASELREISAAAGRGPWKNHFRAMAMKTALIRVCKLLPRTDDLRSLHNIVERDLTREGGKEPPRHERIGEPVPPLSIEQEPPREVLPVTTDELGRDLGEELPRLDQHDIEPPHADEAGA